MSDTAQEPDFHRISRMNLGIPEGWVYHYHDPERFDYVTYPTNQDLEVEFVSALAAVTHRFNSLHKRNRLRAIRWLLARNLEADDD